MSVGSTREKSVDSHIKGFKNRSDTFRFQGMRTLLVDLLREKGIQDDNVLEAIREIPRHLFIDGGFEEHAYQDKAFPIGSDQTISMPYTVALQTALLKVQKGDKILEIGTGSGYQCAVLVNMAAEVYSIERHEALYDSSKELLSRLHYSPKALFYGDGYKGLEAHARYDGIIVTAGAPFVPKPLLSQLKIGGRLIIPIGDNPQVMTLFVRETENRFHKKTYGDFQFVPMLEQTRKK